MEFEEIINKIISKGGLTTDEVKKKILEKQHELSNLISKEGAAYIIAKELGLDIFPKVERRLEIRNVVPMIRDLKLSGRIVRIFETREFETKGRKGRVASLVLGDSSGTIRLTLWDDQTEIIEKLKLGMAVETFGAYSRDNGIGGVEIRLGRRGGIKILEDSDLPSLEDIQKGPATRSRRRAIAELKEGELGEVRASLVQLFENKLFFDICPECGRSVKKEDNYKCITHGEVEPKKSIVLLGVVDDGSANIRAVFFRDVALDLLGMKMEDVLKRDTDIFNDLNILGKEYIMVGKVRRNKIFERLEFVANHVREIDVVHESNKILKDLA